MKLRNIENAAIHGLFSTWLMFPLPEFNLGASEVLIAKRSFRILRLECVIPTLGCFVHMRLPKRDLFLMHQKLKATCQT